MMESSPIDDEGDAPLFEHHRLLVDPGQSLLRIDRYLTDRVGKSSRNKIQEAIRHGNVLVNGETVKPNYRVRPGNQVTIYLPYERFDSEILPEDIPLDVVFEDSSLLVIHKPPGLVVHPGHGNWTGTLVNALAFRYQHLPDVNGQEKPGLVHRIDKDTSGLLLIAKTEAAMTYLARQFFDHSVERSYQALVWGNVEQDEGTVTGNIGRSPSDRKLYSVFTDGTQGKHAVTHYKVLERFRYVTLTECRLETGRTHQIRVHMKHLGHPLFSDAQYGGDKILRGEKTSKYKAFIENCFQTMPRQALHAKTLGFTHPISKERLRFSSELPADFSNVLERWRAYVQHN